MTSKILLAAIESAKNETTLNRRAAEHNLTANINDIIPYDNSAYLDMVSLVLDDFWEQRKEKTLVGKT